MGNPWRSMGGCRVRIETAASWVTPGGCFCRLTWGWGQGWALIAPLVVGGGQFSTLIFLALVMSHGGVLVESVVVVSPPRPLPQDRPLPIPKNRPRIRLSPGRLGLSLWFGLPRPRKPRESRPRPNERIQHAENADSRVKISRIESKSSNFKRKYCDFCADIQIYYP